MNLREFRRILRQAILFPTVLLLLLGLYFVVQLTRTSTELRAVDHSDRITNRIVDLQKLIIDQETGVRGYLLTNDPALLAPYNAAALPIQEHFAELHELLSSNSAQEQRLATVSDRYQVWLSQSQRMIAKDPRLMGDPQVHQQDMQMMDSIRDAVNELLRGEEAWRRALSEREPQGGRTQFISILSASLFIAMALALFIRQRLRKVSRSYSATLEALGKTSREVHESRQWFQTTLESIGDAVISCNIDGRIEFLNAIASGLTGWNAPEALGRPLIEVFQIVHEETREPEENPVQKILRMQKVSGLAHHTTLISRQGREYLIDDSAAPILDAQGEITGAVLVFRDVTEQRRAEAALIAGEKLAVAGRLTASIAHEIHNPLDSVANVLFLLRDEDDAAKRTEYLQIAQQELGRTMQISRTMLSLYREPKAPVPVELKSLIEGVLLLLERRAAQLQIEMKSELPDSCVVEGFPAELRQVVTNVLVNAIEAAGMRGRIRVRLEYAPSEEFRGTGALIEVADSGAGITEAAAQRIFQPFFTTKGEQGTGLGLWVSMGIVQKHGGTIRLQNCGNDGYAGACARIYLPAKTLASADRRTTAYMN